MKSITPYVFIIIGCCLLIFTNTWTNWRQQHPYMDELFHVPQVQEYCRALFQKRLPSYHPSITTLPGIYILPSLITTITTLSIVCQTYALRFYSALMALLCLPLLNSIINLLYTRRTNYLSNNQISITSYQQSIHWHFAFLLWLHPVFLFYANLYYTDTSSLLFILLTWHFSLKGSTTLSALAGLGATLCRQTNIIWHAFIVADAFFHSPHITFVHTSIRIFMKRAIHSVQNQLWQHALVGIIYILFLLINGGVAVGDKQNHSPILHYAMFPYFLGFHTLSFSFFQIILPHRILKHIKLLLRDRSLLQRTVLSTAVIIGMVLKTGNYAHPFVLSDNRHYTFYLYKRILLRSAVVRIFLVPLYVWSAFSIDAELTEFQKTDDCKTNEKLNTNKQMTVHTSVPLKWLRAERILDLLLLTCAGITLIASPLLELRYFVTASLFLAMRRVARLDQKVGHAPLLIMSFFLLLINLAFVWVFNERPFQRPIDPHMPSDRSPGRFMF